MELNLFLLDNVNQYPILIFSILDITQIYYAMYFLIKLSNN